MAVRKTIASVALVATVAVGSYLVLRDDDPDCSFSTSTFDGVPVPGGPQDAEAALAGYLAGPPIIDTNGDAVPTDQDAYTRSDANAESVSFTAGHFVVNTHKNVLGWSVVGTETRCP